MDDKSPIVDIDGTDKRCSAEPKIRLVMPFCRRCKCVANKCDDGGGGRLWPPVVVFDISLDRRELPADIGS